MNSTLQAELQKEMGYSEAVVTCQSCKYHCEESMGEHVCLFNRIGNFRVRSDAHCKFHKVGKYIGESQ